MELVSVVTKMSFIPWAKLNWGHVLISYIVHTELHWVTGGLGY